MKFPVLLLTLLAACDGEEMDGKDSADTAADTAADTDDTATLPSGLAIAGSYVDAFGTAHTITDETWTQQYGDYTPFVFLISSYDNAERWVVAQNDAANPYNAGLWSRFDWVEHEGHLYYCQTAFAAASEAEAVALSRPDDSDPASSGCGGFGWTDLTP